MAIAPKQELDATILDKAGALFARHGFAQTSIQSIASAVGFSKAGLLHHYPNKSALYTAVLDQCLTEMERIRDKLAGVTAGAERDHSAIRLLVDLAMVRPGLVALLLGTAVPSPDDAPELEAMRLLLFRTFDDEPPAMARTVRVMGALAALGVLALAAIQVDETSAWRDDIIATSFSALGQTAGAIPAE